MDHSSRPLGDVTKQMFDDQMYETVRLAKQRHRQSHPQNTGYGPLKLQDGQIFGDEGR